jgi:ankyrin repeat protein
MGIDVNKELIATIRAGSLSRLRAILQSRDLDLERQGRHGWTPLMYAFKYWQGSESMPLALLEHSALIDAEDNDGRTVLHQAAASGQAEMIRLAIRRDASKEARDKSRLTPLLVAVKENHRECKSAVQALLEAGCNAKVHDKEGWTVLHHAAHNSATSTHPFNTYAAHLLGYLLARSNAAVDAKDRAEYTALGRVVGSGDAKTVSILLSNGADPNALNRAGKSLLYLAVHQKPDQPKYSSVIKLLIEHGAIVREEDFLASDYQRFKYLLKKQDDKIRRLSDSSVKVTERIPSFSTATSGDTMEIGGPGGKNFVVNKERKGTGLKMKSLFSKRGSKSLEEEI